jgi:hypothetical protein
MSGGKRLRINDGGYFPQYSPDGLSIAFWRNAAIWLMSSSGEDLRPVLNGVVSPERAVWTDKGLAVTVGQEIRSPEDTLFNLARPVWPLFDVLPDGRFVIAPIDIQGTALWAVDLTYSEN